MTRDSVRKNEGLIRGLKYSLIPIIIFITLTFIFLFVVDKLAKLKETTPGWLYSIYKWDLVVMLLCVIALIVILGILIYLSRK